MNKTKKQQGGVFRMKFPSMKSFRSKKTAKSHNFHKELEKKAKKERSEHKKKEKAQKKSNPSQTKKIKESVSNGMSRLKASASTGMAGLKTSINAKTQKLKESASKGMSRLKSSANAKTQKLKESASTGISNLKSSASTGMSNLKSSASKGMSNLKSSAIAKTQKLKESASTGMAGLKSSAIAKTKKLYNRRYVTDEKGNIIKSGPNGSSISKKNVVTGEDGTPLKHKDGSFVSKMDTKDEEGNSIKDENGNTVTRGDIETDENGKLKKNEDGSFIRKNSRDENGNAYVDKHGKVLTKDQLVMGENGEVLKDNSGNVIKKSNIIRDKNGKIVRDKNGNFSSKNDETDEDGKQILDKKGNVMKRSDVLTDSKGNMIKDADGNYIKNTIGSNLTRKVNKLRYSGLENRKSYQEHLDKHGRLIKDKDGKIMSKNEVQTDEDGNFLKDEKGNYIRKQPLSQAKDSIYPVGEPYNQPYRQGVSHIEPEVPKEKQSLLGYAGHLGSKMVQGAAELTGNALGALAQGAQGEGSISRPLGQIAPSKEEDSSSTSSSTSSSHSSVKSKKGNAPVPVSDEGVDKVESNANTIKPQSVPDQVPNQVPASATETQPESYTNSNGVKILTGKKGAKAELAIMKKEKLVNDYFNKMMGEKTDFSQQNSSSNASATESETKSAPSNAEQSSEPGSNTESANATAATAATAATDNEASNAEDAKPNEPEAEAESETAAATASDSDSDSSSSTTSSTINGSSSSEQADSILNNIQNKHSPIENDENKAQTIISNLITNVMISSIENIAGLMGVDITNADQTNEKLAQIKESLTDPENLEHMVIIISNSAEIAGVAIEALKPYLTELISAIIMSLESFASNSVQAAVSVAMSAFQAIPIIGAFMSAGQTAITLFETGLSLVDTMANITTTTSDTVNAVVTNFERLKREKEQLLVRSEKSIKEYEKKHPVTV